MNKHKRLLSFVLALVLVLGMFPLAAIAADEEAAACEECEAIGGHTAGCSQYVTPKCSECGAELLAETVVHNEGCSQAPVTTDLEDETDTDDSSSTTSETTNETTSETTTEGTTTETTTTETESTEGTTEGTTESTTEPATTPATETTEATTAPTTEPVLCEKCNATESEDGTVVHEKTCEFYVPTTAEKLIAMMGVDSIYTEILNLMQNDPEKLRSMTLDEVKAVYARVNQLDPEQEYEYYTDLVDTLQLLAGEYELAGNPVKLVDKLQNMTQIINIENRAFYLILNRNYYGVMDQTVTSDRGNGATVLGRSNNVETYANSTTELNVSDVSKWLFEPTGTEGEFYVKGLTTGKYMKFNGSTALVDEGIPTRVYGYTTTGVNSKNETTYLTLYALVQADETGVDYILNQLGGASFNGFGGWTDDDEYEKDPGNLFLMKEAYYEAPSDIQIVNNTTSMNAVIKVFNYNETVNNYNQKSGSNEFQFYQGAGYESKMSSKPTDGVTVDGYHTGTTQMATMKPVLVDGYPSSTEFGSFEYLFGDTSSYLEGTMNDGGYLFQQIDNYYVYDSIKNAAWYDEGNNRFVLYDLAISPSYTQTNYLDINNLTTKQSDEKISASTGIEASATDVQSGNFLPFTAIDTNTVYNEGTYQASGVPRYSVRTDVKNDMWFGLSAEFDFYMPEDGKKNGNDMIFDFSGDDDVWVYIDDVLILDIGGTHGAYNGSINFATGDVEYTNPNGTVTTNLKAIYEAVVSNSSVDATVKSKVQDILDNGFDGNTFKDFTKHSFNFYYMERGGNISYCRLKFNMDPLPKGALSVEKKTTNINTVYNNGEYEFTISGKNGDGDDITAPFEYQIITNGVSDETTHYTESGKFTLTDGQIAVFTNIEAGNKILVEETGGTLQYASECTVTGSGTPTDGTNSSSGNMWFERGDSHFEVVFTNTITTKDINISKILNNDDNAPVSDAAYTVKVKIKDTQTDSILQPYTGEVKIGESTVTANSDGQFTIKANETAVIENIPVGYSFEVIEIGTLDGEEFVPSGVTVPGGFEFRNVEYENNTGTVTADTNVNITNTIVAVFGNLTISKTGIDELDHHEAKGNNKEEQQSTVYVISGKSNSGVEVNMEVVIAGNGSVTIRDIPVGTYTVTEKESWSWRYDAVKVNESDDVANGKTAEVRGGQTTTVPFKNERTNPYWLSGDNIAKNLFTKLTEKK